MSNVASSPNSCILCENSTEFQSLIFSPRICDRFLEPHSLFLWAWPSQILLVFSLMCLEVILKKRRKSFADLCRGFLSETVGGKKSANLQGQRISFRSFFSLVLFMASVCECSSLLHHYSITSLPSNLCGFLWLLWNWVLPSLICNPTLSMNLSLLKGGKCNSSKLD